MDIFAMLSMALVFGLAGRSLYLSGHENLACVAVIMALGCIRLCFTFKELREVSGFAMRFYYWLSDGMVDRKIGPWMIILGMAALGYSGNKWAELISVMFFLMMMTCIMFVQTPAKREKENGDAKL